jgi:hypothetical protein
VRTPLGRLHVIKVTRCIECEAHIPAGRTQVCAYCAAEERARIRRASIEAGARKRQIDNLGVAARKRTAKMILAAPKWRDRDKIKAIYDEAKRLTAETGIAHHVDHYYPLQGVLCSGLHVHHNLRVLPASENCSKSNGHPMEESPATAAFIKEYGLNGLRTWVQWAKGEKVRF